jgi:hypothetical protein
LQPSSSSLQRPLAYQSTRTIVIDHSSLQNGLYYLQRLPISSLNLSRFRLGFLGLDACKRLWIGRPGSPSQQPQLLSHTLYDIAEACISRCMLIWNPFRIKYFSIRVEMRFPLEADPCKHVRVGVFISASKTTRTHATITVQRCSYSDFNLYAHLAALFVCNTFYLVVFRLRDIRGLQGRRLKPLWVTG